MRSRMLGIILLGVDLLAAWCIAEVVLGSRHTLLENGRWISTKAILGRHVLGSFHFLSTRTALHRNRLDLSTWHGWNEVTYREPIQRGSVEFDYAIEDQA